MMEQDGTLANLIDRVRRVEQASRYSRAMDETGNLIYGSVFKSDLSGEGFTSVPLIFTATTTFPLLIPDWVRRIQRAVLRVRFTGTMSLTGVSIDGLDRTVALGGPWTLTTNIDIKLYLLDVRGIPVLGDHLILVTVAGAGSIQITPDMFFVSKPTI